MKERLNYALALLLAAGFFYGAVRLFGIQFTAGEVYPEYSSLRSDPSGSKLLFDSLKALPGVRAERNFLPLEYLPGRGATLLFLGWELAPLAENQKLLERAAARGNRVVLALHLQEAPKPADLNAFQDAWHIRIEEDRARNRAHRFALTGTTGWKVLDQAGPKVLAVEQDVGQGSVAFLAESDDFSNQSLIAGDRLRQVTEAIGANPYVVFDEHHLGIASGGSMVDMARRFRLNGLMAGLGLLAALFLWKNAAGFPPTAARSVERLTGRTSQAGLLTLLQRHVPARDLTAACWREWVNGNGGQANTARARRAAEIAQQRADQPLEAAREIAAVLHGKGEL